MLVLTRRKGEEIVIDGRIRVVILDVRGNKVRCGVDAPRGMNIHRREVFEEIEREKQQKKEFDNPPVTERSNGVH